MISGVIPAMSRGTIKLQLKATEFPAFRPRYETDTDRTQVSSVTVEAACSGVEEDIIVKTTKIMNYALTI
jgi:hypothetical protein